VGFPIVFDFCPQKYRGKWYNLIEMRTFSNWIPDLWRLPTTFENAYILTIPKKVASRIGRTNGFSRMTSHALDETVSLWSGGLSTRMIIGMAYWDVHGT